MRQSLNAQITRWARNQYTAHGMCSIFEQLHSKALQCKQPTCACLQTHSSLVIQHLGPLQVTAVYQCIKPSHLYRNFVALVGGATILSIGLVNECQVPLMDVLFQEHLWPKYYIYYIVLYYFQPLMYCCSDLIIIREFEDEGNYKGITHITVFTDHILIFYWIGYNKGSSLSTINNDYFFCSAGMAASKQLVRQQVKQILEKLSLDVQKTKSEAVISQVSLWV